MTFIGFIPLLLLILHHVNAGQSSCQDIDHDACVSMHRQNPNMCSDTILSNTACPATCSKCPITCYNCNTSTTDISQCNTNTCSNGEMCLLKTVHNGSNSKQYTMICGATMICSLTGRRNVSPYITIICCGQDLCNAPVTTTTTETTTTTTSTTTQATSTKPAQPTHPSHTTKTFWNQKPTTYQTSGCTRDIIFMIEDSMGMIAYFDRIKEGILGIISQLNIGFHGTRVAMGTFNVAGTTRWGFYNYLDKVSLENAVRYLNPNGNTAPFASNMAAVEHILQSFKNGNRPNVTDVIILLTEAHTENDWVFQAVTGHSRDVAINQLHQRSHNVIAIAAGGADTSLVRRIATDSDHFYHIIDFPDWRSQHIDNKIIKLICL